jgi:competence protein ComEC
MLAAIGTLIVYAQLVGGGASVDRATLMGVVYFAARAIDQRSPSLNILSVVVAILVAAAPLSVADPAFILTSGATLGILVVGAVVSRWPARPFVRAVATTFAASVAAEAMLFPVGALFFSRITGAGLALNLLAIPLMGVAQIAGMAVVPLALISPNVAAAAGFVANAGATGLLWSADLVRFVPVVTYRVAAPSWWSVIGYYSGLVVWWALARRQVAVTGSSESWSATSIRRAAAAMAVSSALWILAEPWRLTTVRGDGRLHVTVIDVGQGDSIFVRFPRGSTLLVDTGGLPGSSAFDIGDRIVAPVIRAAGVGRLDVVALTHGDPDHLGGAASIVREFRPRAVWEGIPVPRFQPLTEVRAEAEAAGAWWTNVYSGHRVVVEGVEIIAKHPHVAEWERQKVRNDDSLVLELRWREVSIVLTGDIEEATERTLVDAFDAAPLRVVKIPHHGSLTSSTSAFVRALHPEVAIVSAGRSNHFGHPVPDVLERYQDINAEIFRTDRDGAVTVATDGTSLDVDTYTGRHAQWSGAAPHPDGAKAAKSLED